MKEILTAWQWDGPVSEPIPYGEGHINQTYAITVTSEQGAKRYILQKINTNTFKDPAGLMENICGVTDCILPDIRSRCRGSGSYQRQHTRKRSRWGFRRERPRLK